MEILNLHRNFITFEGVEGCGKSTHSKLLADFLKTQGFAVILTREPGGTKIGESIRKILLDSRNTEISYKCELLLYMASRSQLIEQVIKPNLLHNKIVICDRFVDATICYQGYGSGIDLKIINQLANITVGDIIPKLTFFLDVDVKKAINSIKKPDRMEKKSLEFHDRVRKGYLKLTKQFPDRIKKIKVRDNIDDTQNEIRKITLDFLKK